MVYAVVQYSNFKYTLTLNKKSKLKITAYLEKVKYLFIHLWEQYMG